MKMRLRETAVIAGMLMLASCTGGGSPQPSATSAAPAHRETTRWELFAFDPSGPWAVIEYTHGMCDPASPTLQRKGARFIITVNVGPTHPPQCIGGILVEHRRIALPGWRICSTDRLIDGATGHRPPVAHPHRPFPVYNCPAHLSNG